MEFTVADAKKFQLSDGKNLFTSGEEVRLLYHAIEDTPYDVVSNFLICELLCVP